MAEFKVITGLDYAGKRAEPGAVVDDIPAKSVTWLLDQGLIERVEKAKSEPVSPSKGDK